MRHPGGTYRREAERRPLQANETHFVVRDLTEDVELFSVAERSFMDERTGPTTVEERAVYRGGCGHMVGFVGPAELAAACHVCGTTLCHRCQNLRCARCLGIICTRDARWWRDHVYCVRCRLKTVGWFLTLGCIGLVGGLFVVFLRGVFEVLGAGLRGAGSGVAGFLYGLHRILSKEF